MKKILKSRIALMVIAIILSGYASNKSIAQVPVTASVSYQNFYDDLSPFGTWLDYPAYGHVWHPSITGNFRPYLTNGYWDFSGEGWMWQSSYNWGWAPFHYGRWVYDDMYGWLWIPGYEWSPAWVTWGTFDNYYGWAPLMPGVNVGIAFSSWRPAAFYWNIVGRDHICDRDIFNHAEKRQVAANAIGHLTIINNFSTTNIHSQYYAKGPDVNEVEKYTNRKIEPALVKEVNTAESAKHEGNEIQVYRPTVTNPLPREFRRVDNNTASPVRNNEDDISKGENEQMENINRLPVKKAPESTFSHGYEYWKSGNGGRRSRRN